MPPTKLNNRVPKYTLPWTDHWADPNLDLLKKQPLPMAYGWDLVFDLGVFSSALAGYPLSFAAERFFISSKKAINSNNRNKHPVGPAISMFNN